MFGKLFLKIFLVSLIVKPIYSQFVSYQVSGLNSYYPEEVSIAVNPAEPNILAAGSNLDYLYRSEDYGKTWRQKGMSSSLGVWGDPCLLYDDQGNLYYAHLSNPIEGYWIDRIVVQKSTDNGMTWNDGAGIGLQYPKNQDKEWLAVDLTNSQYRNNIYISWTEFDGYDSNDPQDSSRILFSKSTDFGETWLDPIKLSDKGGNCLDGDETVEGAVPAVGPNGEIYVSWSGPNGIMFDKSLDGGNTFGKDIFVNEHLGGWDFNIPGISRCNGLPVTCCDVSNSEFRGNVYILWGELPDSSNNADVYISKSTDKGETWSQKIKVNDDETERHQFFPWLSVDPKTGYLYVVFYDRRNTTVNQTDVYIARSTDGGETFQNFKINDDSFTPISSVFFGDYINIASLDGNIYPIWTKYSSNRLSIWATPIKDSMLVTNVHNDKGLLVNDFRLMQNYPNPFNPSTTITYHLPKASYVKISIYDGLGQLKEEIVNEFKSAGVHEVNYKPENLASGMYLYRLEADNFSEVKKMIFLK